jgi:alkylated DNA nucleotide flippase Atl1
MNPVQLATTRWVADGRLGQIGRLAGIDRHPRVRARRIRRVVEAALRVKCRVVRQHGEAPADARTLQHPLQQRGFALALELARGPGVVGRVALTGRNGRGDGIDAR